MNLRRGHRFRKRQRGIFDQHAADQRNEEHAQDAAGHHEGGGFPVRRAGREIKPGTRDHERRDGEDRARRDRFADGARSSGDILFKDGPFKDAQYGHADDGRRISCGDGLSGLQAKVGIGRAQDHAHHEPEQHGPQREFLHLDVRWDERLVLAGRGHESLAFTFSLRIFPSTVLPASFACAALMTMPICFEAVAPVSARAAATAFSMSSSLADAGR